MVKYNGRESIPEGGEVYYFTWLTHDVVTEGELGRVACIIVDWLDYQLRIEAESNGEIQPQPGEIRIGNDSDWYCHQMDVEYSAHSPDLGIYVLTIDDYIIVAIVEKPDYRWIVKFEVFRNRTAAIYVRKYFNEPQLANNIFGEYIEDE